MQEQWWEYLIGFFLTLLATGSGVFVAFWLDGFREKKNFKQQKKNLINALYNEVRDFKEFFAETEDLSEHVNYSIESHILEETGEEQIKYLDNMELLLRLSTLRRFTKRINKKFESLEFAVRQFRVDVNNLIWKKQIETLKEEWKNDRMLIHPNLRITFELLEKERSKWGQ